MQVMKMTTFGEKTYQGEIVKGVTRHRDPMRCAVGALAYWMAFRMDHEQEPIFREMANAETMQGTALLPNVRGGKDAVSAPLWMGRYFVYGKYGARTAVTSNLLSKD